MARDKPTDMQLASAKCVTNLYRADAISAEDPKILYKTLPVLVSITGVLQWNVKMRLRILRWVGDLYGSFQFAAEDHKEGTVCGRNVRSDSGRKK